MNTLDWNFLGGFLLVLSRLGAVLVFVPIPGVKAAPEMVRVVLAFGLSAALYPALPLRGALPQAGGAFLLLMAAEAGYGLVMGHAVALLHEVLTFSMQSFALQAGYSYASSIDPQSEADSGVLIVFSQLAGHLFFFALGGYQWVLRAFARSLEAWPVGGAPVGLQAAEVLARLGSSLLELSLRLALPLIALLLLVEITLGVLSRLQTQLQLLTLAFPVKLSGTLLVLAALTPAWAYIYQSALGRSTSALERLWSR